MGLAGLVLTAVAVSVQDGIDRGNGLRPGPAEEAAVARLAADTGPWEAVCIEPESAGLWIPALAGRRVSHPWTPVVYREELAATVTSFDVCR